MSEMILNDMDLMDASHWPITVSFGLYNDPEPNCASIVREASMGNGYSFNDKGIVFWSELDEYEQAHEKPFDVECFLLDDACRLTYDDFFHYMKIACERYAARFPEKTHEFEECLNEYAARFLQQEP